MAMMIEELEVSCFQVSSEPALVIVTALLSYYSQYLRHDGNVRKLASEAATTGLTVNLSASGVIGYLEGEHATH